MCFSAFLRAGLGHRFTEQTAAVVLGIGNTRGLIVAVSVLAISICKMVLKERRAPHRLGVKLGR